MLRGCSQGRRRRNEKGALGESQGGGDRRPRRTRTGGGWRGCGAEKRVGEEHPPASAASEGRWQAPCEAPSGFSALRSRVVVLGTWASGGGRRRAQGQTTAPKGLVLSAAGRPDRVLALAVRGVVRSARLRRVYVVTGGPEKERRRLGECSPRSQQRLQGWLPRRLAERVARRHPGHRRLARHPQSSSGPGWRTAVLRAVAVHWRLGRGALGSLTRP